jgi:hypothetical protein
VRFRHPILALATVGLLLLAGCGDDGDSEVDAGSDSSSAPDTTAPEDTTAPDEPVTVADAVGLPEGSSVTIRGYVFQPDEGATIMCDVFGESFPPTCTGATLTTDGLDVNSLPNLETTSGGDLVAPATWTSEPVEVSGQLQAGRLVVSS